MRIFERPRERSRTAASEPELGGGARRSRGGLPKIVPIVIPAAQSTRRQDGLPRKYIPNSNGMFNQRHA